MVVDYCDYIIERFYDVQIIFELRELQFDILPYFHHIIQTFFYRILFGCLLSNFYANL